MSSTNILRRWVLQGTIAAFVIAFATRLNVQSPQHQVRLETTILSRNPLIIYIANFVNESEINHLLHARSEGAHTLNRIQADDLSPSAPNFQRMLTYDGDSIKDALVEDEGRTSSSAYIDRDDPVVQSIGRRALSFQTSIGQGGDANDGFGNPQFVEYFPSQQVRLHYDWWHEAQSRHGRLYNRRNTFLIYLEADCSGGETFFPHVEGLEDIAKQVSPGARSDGQWSAADDQRGLYIVPRRGSAVFWVNLHKNGSGDERTLHAGVPVTKGRKVVMNFWPPRYFEIK